MLQSVIFLLSVVSTHAIIGTFTNGIQFNVSLKDQKFDCTGGPQKSTISWQYKDTDKWDSLSNTKAINIWLMRDILGQADPKIVLLGTVKYPTTTFEFVFPGEFPKEWSASTDTRAQLLNNGEEYKVFFYLESVEDETLNSKNTILADPDFSVTCCKAGNTNCACTAGSQCVEKDASCVDSVCTKPSNTPAPVDPRTNSKCSRPGTRTDPEGDVCGKLVNGVQSELACRLTEFGTRTCQPCNPGSEDCVCKNQACALQTHVCLNGRCVPDTGCENCPCDSGVCNTASLICVNNVCKKPALTTAPPPTPRQVCQYATVGCPCRPTATGLGECGNGLVCERGICLMEQQGCPEGTPGCRCATVAGVIGCIEGYICKSNFCLKDNRCESGSLGCPCARTASGIVGCTSEGLICRDNLCIRDQLGNKATTNAPTATQTTVGPAQQSTSSTGDQVQQSTSSTGDQVQQTTAKTVQAPPSFVPSRLLSVPYTIPVAAPAAVLTPSVALVISAAALAARSN